MGTVRIQYQPQFFERYGGAIDLRLAARQDIMAANRAHKQAAKQVGEQFGKRHCSCGQCFCGRYPR